MKKISCLLLFLFPFICWSQSDSAYTQDYIYKSTKFAWLTIGGDINYLTGGKTQRLVNSQLESTEFGTNIFPRLTIGGIHFWGHADFYVSFPLSFLSYQEKVGGLKELSHINGVETGARIYPFKLEKGSLRPFVGISFRRLSFQQEEENSNYSNGTPAYGRFIQPLQFGATFTNKKWHFSASAYYNYQSEFNYFISPNQEAVVKLDPLSFNISILRHLDTDAGMRNSRNIAMANVAHQILEKKKRLSAWFYGIGPSSALQMTQSSFLKVNFPYFYDQYSASILPDLSFGRYFHKADLNVNLSYRTYGDEYEGFDNKIEIRRHSLGVESTKALFNWLGFVPFLGAAITYENMATDVNGRGFRSEQVAAGIVFGWDIRVTKTTTGLLRTNLRYFPNLHMDIGGEKMMYDHLEFNFIQWVQFIGRKKALRQR